MSDFEQKLIKHSDEDSKKFKEIKDILTNHSELMKINGEHLSYFNKSQLEIKEILRVQNENDYKRDQAFAKLVSDFNQHRDRMEPLARNWEDSEKLTEILARKASKFKEKATFITAPISWLAGTVIALAALVGAIIYLIDKF